MLVAAVLLLLLLVPFALVALLIVLDSPGPVFYKAERVGMDWGSLTMVKFRTMWRDAAGPRLTVEGDPRFTRIGKLLSKAKVDELPQLWNVLRGQMSLIGPRPQSPEFARCYRDEYNAILSVRPGITGLTQVAFANENCVLRPDDDDRVRHYVEVLLPQKLRIDRLYIENRTTRMDARIVLWTSVATVARRQVAVHRSDGRMSLRRRAPLTVASPASLTVEPSPVSELA